MKYGNGYCRVTEATVWFGTHIFKYRDVEAREMLSFLKGKNKILDLGCNIGLFSRMIKDNYPLSEVWGADINKDAIRHAKKEHKDIKFAISDEKFYKSHKFDCVLLSHVLEHVKDPNEFISRIKGILKPGGLLVIAVPQEIIRGDKSLAQILFNLLKMEFENPHLHKISLLSCGKMLKRNGFGIISHKYINIFPPYVEKKRRLYAWSLLVQSRLK